MPDLEQLYQLGKYIDTRAPGFSARVAQATHWESGQDVAFKVLRREHLQDGRVWVQFATEAALLELLRHTGPVNQMVDCGYVSDPLQERPAGGEILSCGRDVKSFRREMHRSRDRGWRPYIALELLPAEHSLLNLILGTDGAGARPLRLPTEEGLALALQFADFLREAHAREVVYWDHKPEHVYWDGQRLRIIDLNVSRFLGPSLGAEARAAEKRKDLQHLVAGALYTVFTGRDFRYQDRLPQAVPSSPKAVAERFRAIKRLDFGMDDTLLPELCELLNQFAVGAPPSAAGQHTAEALLKGLRRLAAGLGWEEMGYPVNEEARAARQEIQQGLAELRQAQAIIDRARQRFLKAHTLNPLERDSERLYQDAGEFYQHRVLP